MSLALQRVLLVDDNEDDYLIVRDLLGDLLGDARRDALKIEWANSYDAARQALTRQAPARESFDVCLLDYRLDGRTGLELLQELPPDNPIPIILLTGNEDHRIDIAAAKAGASDYLVKGRLNSATLERSIRYAIERKASEAALLQAQRFTQATVDALPDSLAVINNRGEVVAVNAMWRDSAATNSFAGASCNVGTNYLDFCDQHHAPHGLAEGIRDIISGDEEDFCFEYPGHETSDGQPWFQVCVTRFADKGPLHVVVTHADITARKRAEERLRQSEANLAKAQQIAHLGSWEKDLSDPENLGTTPLHWSDEVFRIFGYQPGEIEVSYANFMGAVHPDDRALIEAAMEAAIREGTPYSIEHRILLPGGEERVVHEQAEIVFEAATHKPLKMIGTVLDITARKKSEESLRQSGELLRAVTESTSDAIFAKDAEGRYLMINAVGAGFLGYDAEKIVGKTDAELLPAEAAHEFRNNDRHIMASGVVQLQEETATTAGVMRTYLASKGPLRGPNGAVVGVVGISRDISERKSAEAQLQFQKTRLEAQTEAALDGILVVSEAGEILSYNRRFVQIWGVPAEVVARGDDSLVVQEGMKLVADPKLFFEKVTHLYNHPQESSQDEVLLRDGRTLDRYSAPITGADGTHYGRVWYFRDITEGKAASAAMARLAAIVESSSDAIISKTLDGTITSWNAGAQALYGYSAEEVIGRSVSMMLAPERPDETARLLDKIGRGESVTGYETIRVAKGGRRLNVSLTLSPIKNQAGEIEGAAGILRDISDRKKSERALRDSEERFQSIVSSVPGMVYQFILHADGRMEWPFVSQGCQEIFEITPEQLKRHPKFTLERLYLEDRHDFERKLEFSAETLSPWHWEGRYRLKSGKIKWIEGASRPERLPGGATLWNGLITDISARKEAEAERDHFFTMSPDMLGIAGFNGYFKRLNPAFSKMLGFSTAELLETPFIERVHPDDRAATSREIDSLIAGYPLSNFENRYCTKDGEWRWLEWEAISVVEESVIYAAARDVTGRKESEAALLQLRDELEMRVEERTAELEQSNTTLQVEYLERERAEREVRAQARQHEAVAELGRRALMDTDMDTLVNGAIALIASTLEASYSSFWTVLPDDTLRQHAVVGLSAWDVSAVTPMKMSDAFQVGYCARRNESVIAEDLQSETRFVPHDFLLQRGVQSSITVPVYNDVLHGVLSASFIDKRSFGQNEIFFLQAVANVLASAIARQQAEAEIHQLNTHLRGANDELRANETRLLQGNQISTDLMQLRVKSQQELEEALHQITEAACRMLDVERSSVWLFNQDESALHCLDLFQRSSQQHTANLELPKDEAYFNAIKEESILLADEMQTYPATRNLWESYARPNGITSTLDVPLVMGGKHIGVLCNEHVGPPRQWQAEDRTFASAVASLCSLVLESYERARAETALQAAKEEAELATAEANAANRAKSEFLSRMSHELRTPLNAILGFGQILEMRSSDPKQLANTQQILKAGRHLLDLINEVLDISRIEAGQLSLSLEPICVSVLVQETLDLVRPLAAGRRITLFNQVSGEKADWHLWADQQRFKQVLVNLMSNAVKYNREGGSVFVSCEVVSDALTALHGNACSDVSGDVAAEIAGENAAKNLPVQGRLRVMVSDSGNGIAPADITRLFMPFERLDAAHTQIEGTGIGLALCKRLMEAMNGKIGVLSEVGRGSTFWAELPLAKSPLERATQQSSNALDGSETSVVEDFKTILYIEDNLSNINLIQQALAAQNYRGRFLTAMQGSVGLDLATQHQPDLILLDVHLPDIMGDVVLSRLKAEAVTREIPVVVLSADATPSQVKRLLEGGAEAYLTKPLDLKHFFSVLKQLLERVEEEPGG